MKNPFHHFSETLVSIFTGQRRIAGLVVEHDRLRFAEYRPAQRNHTPGGRVLVEEGAVFLSKATIRDGTLVRPDLFTQAVVELKKRGTPHVLSATSVILSLPLAHVIGRTVAVPAGIREDEIEGVLRLELERILPFPASEAYLDWQEVLGRAAADAKGTERLFLIAAVRRGDVDSYITAVQAAGCAVVALEPLTMSIARGLEKRSGVTYAVLVQRDAMLAVSTDADGNVRMFHHRSIPEASDAPEGQRESESRAKAILGELSSFIRFFRSEIGGTEQEIVFDGVFDESVATGISHFASDADIPIRIERDSHGLSKAAVRGAALRALVPRAEDRIISLMAQGTEAAFKAEQQTFFMGAAFRIAILGTVLVFLLYAGATALLWTMGRAMRNDVQKREGVIVETQQTITEISGINEAIARAVALLPAQDIPPVVFAALQRSAPDEITVNRIAVRISGGALAVDLAVQADSALALRAEQEVLSTRFTDTVLVIPPQLFLQQELPISYVFSFLLRSGGAGQ